MSLDEAREELKKRWSDIVLKKKIEEELGDKFITQFNDSPQGVSFRQVCSPDNGFTFFYQCSKYVGAKPLVLEYHEDIFVHFNEEKKGLGRLRLTLNDGSRVTADIMNFHENEKRKLCQCILKNGQSLIDFHHNLFKASGYDIELHENSDWFKCIGKAANYYYYLLLHFVAHGALFEVFSVEDGESRLIEEAVEPAMERILEKFGFAPIIVKAYPDNQNVDEDFYWWSYPPILNDKIIQDFDENIVFKYR